MPTPTIRQLSDPAFVKAMMDCIRNNHAPITNLILIKRPKFRKMREVHAARARKLRRRGEDVYFLRWDHGHCIYGWSGKPPETIMINRIPRKASEPVYTQLSYRTEWVIQ